MNDNRAREIPLGATGYSLLVNMPTDSVFPSDIYLPPRDPAGQLIWLLNLLSGRNINGHVSPRVTISDFDDEEIEITVKYILESERADKNAIFIHQGQVFRVFKVLSQRFETGRPLVITTIDELPGKLADRAWQVLRGVDSALDHALAVWKSPQHIFYTKWSYLRTENASGVKFYENKGGDWYYTYYAEIDRQGLDVNCPDPDMLFWFDVQKPDEIQIMLCENWGGQAIIKLTDESQSLFDKIKILYDIVSIAGKDFVGLPQSFWGESYVEFVHKFKE